MSRFHVEGKVVQQVDLLKKRKWSWRLDVWPFAILYVLWVATVVPSLDFVDAAIVFGGLVAFHILVLLFTAWSVDFRCFVQYSKVKNIHHANACKITPAKFSGSKEVVELQFRKIPRSTTTVADIEEIYFDFRKQCFIFSKEKDTFCKLPYPSKESLGYYLKSTGHGSEAKVAVAVEKWGRNVFEYPQPTFQKLMKEHCMEPFFVFQVFCVGLWCLDEYWYYSLFTLFMLFLFESTMAKSRLKTLTELRRVKVDSQTLMVHRCGKWVKLSGTDLLPGDVVSIGRSSGQNGEDKSVPADMLILAGSAIVNEAILTGESTPQWKVSIMGRGIEEKLSSKRDKSHILFGGTKILQHTPDKSFHLKTPDGGCLAVVLRTGFETSQGKLMRTILFSTERVTANSWESGLFILFLVVFAIIAAGYVLKKGLEDPTRSKYKLFLSCSLIITSVIPPELPMELSIAVNTSLIALARRGIFCTEPFRIPFAGKVDICCFDKTGTLTSDDMEFQGVVGLSENVDLESDMTKVPLRTLEILSACHALVYVDNKLVGDPLEKAAIKGIDWVYTSDEKAMPKRGGNHVVQIVQRHHFASHLKRMAVVVRIQEEFFAFVKGAPETIRERLIDIPSSYVETYKKYTRQGSRVLALAYKPLSEMSISEARSLDRDYIEGGLTFAGFVVFNCPIRADSASVLSELKASSHDLVMITGDQALTACHVASQVHIISKPTLILGPARNGVGFEWISPDETEFSSYSDNAVEALSETHDLCIGGDCFEMLQQTSSVLRVIPFVKVFARVAPEQKELIMTTFKIVGRTTLMCGDGTNDVGALQRSFQIHIPFEIPDELTISAKLCVSNVNVVLEEKSTSTTATADLSNEISYSFEVQHLPPVVLTCLLPKSYPSHQPPYFIISMQWLDSLRISKLCCMLDSLWASQPNQEVIHQWAEWLHSSSLPYLEIDKDIILGPYNLPVTGDRRAVSGSVSPEIDIPLLMKYNDEKCHEVFRENLHECCICYSEYTGTEFIRLPCKHFFCRKCMETYSSIHVKECTVHQLLCPDCGGMVPPDMLKLLLGNEEFEQWESLLLQKTLESMSDIIYCPRCESICLEDGDHHAQCPQCFFSFCSICRLRRHVGIGCVPPGLTLEILMERQSSSQLSEDQKRRELDKINEIISINMILLDSRQCPFCKTAVFRTAGCNKIICKCGKFFCYQCGEAITDGGHFRRGCRLFPREAIYTREQERQPVGVIEIEHPFPICRQTNVKDTNDNHILCQTCQNHYCYLCHRSVRDSFQHFGPSGCQRFTIG